MSRLIPFGQIDGKFPQHATLEVDPKVIAIIWVCAKDTHGFLAALRKHLKDQHEPFPASWVDSHYASILGERLNTQGRPGHVKNFEFHPQVRAQLQGLPPELFSDLTTLTPVGQRRRRSFSTLDAHHGRTLRSRSVRAVPFLRI